MGAIDYKQVELAVATEMQTDLQKKLAKRTAAEGGKIDSVQNLILNYIVQGEYETAKSELDRFVVLKNDYPTFGKRVAPYVEHCKDIINAIETKRNLPGISSLSKSKQQDLNDKVLEHFDELRDFLKKIEQVEAEEYLSDMRSSIWVLRTLCACVMGVLIVLFVTTDMVPGFKSLYVVLDKLVNDATEGIF